MDKNTQQATLDDAVKPNPKLFVGGLAWAATDDDLREAFTPFGEIIEAAVVRYPDTGRSKGFGFVRYATTDEASAAQEALDGKEIVGRVIKVSFARERKDREVDRSIA